MIDKENKRVSERESERVRERERENSRTGVRACPSPSLASAGRLVGQPKTGRQKREKMELKAGSW